MTNIQRLRNDVATRDRRETADDVKRDNRLRNDSLTGERRFNADRGEIADKATRNTRNKNDELTEERRFKEDKTMAEHRFVNDELTTNRRDIKDGNQGMAVAISFLLLVVLAVGIFFILI